MICSECGNGDLRLTSEPVTVEYRGERVTVDGVEHWQCDKCGGYEMDMDEAAHLAKMVHDAWVAKHGYDPLTPREIRKLRRSLGMTQVQFEHALGLKSPTVSRWENGKVVPSATADILMRTIARNAAMTDRPTFVVYEGGSRGDPSGPYRPSTVGGDDYAMEG